MQFKMIWSRFIIIQFWQPNNSMLPIMPKWAAQGKAGGKRRDNSAFAYRLCVNAKPAQIPRVAVQASVRMEKSHNWMMPCFLSGPFWENVADKHAWKYSLRSSRGLQKVFSCRSRDPINKMENEWNSYEHELKNLWNINHKLKYVFSSVAFADLSSSLLAISAIQIITCQQKLQSCHYFITVLPPFNKSLP